MPQVLKLVKEERVSVLLMQHSVKVSCPVILLHSHYDSIWQQLMENCFFFVPFYFQLLELFGCGTACVVSPVNRIQYMGEDIAIPTMKQHNPIFEQLKTELTDIQYGRKEHPWAVLID